MSRFRDLVLGRKDPTPAGNAAYADRQYMDLVDRIPIGISRPDGDRTRIAPPPSAFLTAGESSPEMPSVSGDTVIGRRRQDPAVATEEIAWKEIDALPADQQILQLRQLLIDHQDQVFRLRKQIGDLEQQISDLRLQRDQQTELVGQSRRFLLDLVHACPQSATLHLSGRGFPEEWTLAQMHAFLMESIAALASQSKSVAQMLEAERARWQQQLQDLQQVVFRLQSAPPVAAEAQAELDAVLEQIQQQQVALENLPAAAEPPAEPAIDLPDDLAAALPDTPVPVAPVGAIPPAGTVERDQQGRVREMVIVDMNEYQRLFDEDERAKELFHIIGTTGLSRASDLSDLEAVQTLFSNRSDLHKTLNKLASLGFLDVTESKAGVKGRPPTIYQISDRGKAMYRTLFTADPVPSEVERLVRIHSSLEHGFFIKDVARALQEHGFTVHSEREECTFNVQVDGAPRRVVYDLVAERQQEGAAEPEVVYIECEMGTQNDALFQEKCEKIYHHNPRAIYFVCPSDTVMTQKTAAQFDRWVKVRGGRKSVSGLTAHFTTLDLLRRRTRRDGAAADFWGCWNKKNF